AKIAHTRSLRLLVLGVHPGTLAHPSASWIPTFVSRLTPVTRGTSAAAPGRAPLRSPVRSTAIRTAASPQAFATARRRPAALRRCRGNPLCRQTPASEAGVPLRAWSTGPPLPRSRRGEIAGSARRPIGGFRQPDPELQDLELLLRIEQSGCVAGFVQEPPEVVARVGEVRAGSGRDEAGIDAAEDDAKARP